MRKEFTIIPNNVCSREIHLIVEDDIVVKCEFIGGCQGNTTGVSRLVEGMKVDEVIKRLEGIECRGSRTRLTSCPDQLAKGLKENC